jgi:TIR domain/NACHT domain
VARVFISYSHHAPDESLAQELSAALDQAHRVFIDTKIVGGRTWGEVIEHELQTADFLIPLLSARSVVSPMVVAEIATAHKLNVNRGRPGIIPVRLDDTQFRYPVTAYVSRFQEIAWAGPGDTPRVMQETLRALDQKPILFVQSPERQQMIQRVRADWIAGILHKSLYGIAPIIPDVLDQPRAVEHRVDAIIQRPDEEPVPLKSGTKLSSVFDEHLGQLLILGGPGSGKTTLLLELASELLDRAEADFNKPIPVIFNLSPWADRRPPLQEWLIEELRLRSDVPREIAATWVRQDQLLLLLDGLDEVAAAHRDACVDAINTYRGEHGFVKMAVCSRSEEYRRLTRKLRLPAAILILPLSRDQILRYLNPTGATSPLVGVRTALEADPGLWALLETPLTLSIVAIVGEKLRPLQSGAGGTTDERRGQLFAYYVDAMFRRRTKEERYTPDQMRRWLTWLAKTLVNREQTSFRIEDLRRGWLNTRLQRFCVLCAISLFIAVVNGLLGGVFMIAFLTDLVGYVNVKESAYFVVVFFLPFLVAIGLALALVRGRLQEPVDLVEVRWPGFRRLFLAALEGGVLGALLGIVFGWAGCAVYDATNGSTQGLEPANYAVMGAIAFGLGSVINTLARTRDLEIRPTPNFALSQSLRNTLAYVGISLMFGIMGIVLLRLLIPTLPTDPGPGLTTAVFALGGLGFLGWVGLFFGMEKGGYFLLDHYLTRLLLWRRGRMPWNYLRFLDAAAERVLLLKVGAGYIFVHRMLLDYFASHAAEVLPQDNAKH